MRSLDRDFEPPSRLFNERALGALIEIKPRIDCECPNHLAALVSSLVAFESYSKNCEDKSPEDAEIHSRLYRDTAAARAILEGALDALCKFEGIDPRK